MKTHGIALKVEIWIHDVPFLMKTHHWYIWCVFYYTWPQIEYSQQTNIFTQLDLRRFNGTGGLPTKDLL